MLVLTPLFIGGLGPWEVLIILVVVLLLFGGRKIPQLARDLGSGIKEFKKSITSSSNEDAGDPGKNAGVDNTLDDKPGKKKKKS